MDGTDRVFDSKVVTFVVVVVGLLLVFVFLLCSAVRMWRDQSWVTAHGGWTMNGSRSF